MATSEHAGRTGIGAGLPMAGTAQTLNRRMGLYMSEGQQRGLAVGLFVGTVAASALLAWGVTEGIRRSRR